MKWLTVSELILCLHVRSHRKTRNEEEIIRIIFFFLLKKSPWPFLKRGPSKAESDDRLKRDRGLQPQHPCLQTPIWKCANSITISCRESQAALRLWLYSSLWVNGWLGWGQVSGGLRDRSRVDWGQVSDSLLLAQLPPFEDHSTTLYRAPLFRNFG